MIYSVFSYDRRTFDYFEAPGIPPATGSFRMPGPAMVPESLLARLPAGARQVGSGDQAKGVIATTDGALAGLSSVEDTRTSSFFWTAGWAAVAGFCFGRWRR